MMPLRSITYRVTRVHRSDAANEMLARESHEQMTAEDIAPRRHRYAASLPATCIQGVTYGRGDDVPARSRYRIHARLAVECTAVGRAAVRTAMGGPATSAENDVTAAVYAFSSARLANAR